MSLLPPSGPLDPPAPLPGGSDAAVVETTPARFMADVIEASQQQVVLVDFWAPWCGPCRSLTPVLEKLAQASQGRVRLAKVNIEQHQMLATQFQVREIPLVYAFVNGRPMDGFKGVQPESAIRQMIDRLLPLLGPSEDAFNTEEALAAAAAALDEGALDEAGAIYAMVLEQNPESAPAVAGMVRIALTRRDFDGAAAFLAAQPEAVTSDAAVRQVATALGLARTSAPLSDPAAMQARLAADPTDHEARYALAQHAIATGQMDSAADHLLDSIARDRTWNDGAARKRLLELFEAMGLDSPFTLAQRRRLSAILFS